MQCNNYRSNGTICRGAPPHHHALAETPMVVRPEKWGDSQVGFRGSNASGGRIVLLPGALFGARCFQNGHFGRISSALYFTAFQSLGGHASTRRVSHEPCFRQAHCFVQGPLRFLPVPPNPSCARSHILGFSNMG